MFLKKIMLLVLVGTTIAHATSIEENQPLLDTNETLRGGPENKSFSNVRVYNTLQTKDLYVEGNTIIGDNLKVNKNTIINGNLTVDGIISGSGIGNISGPGSSTVNAVARFSNATGTGITDSPVLIDNAGNMSGINNLSMSGGDLTGVNNATMTGNLTGATNITMAGGDVTGLNNLSMAGDLTGVQNVTMTGDILGATNITMNGGNLTGVQDITMTGTLTGVTNIITSGVITAQDLSSSGTLLVSAIANINSPSAVITWPTMVGAAGTFLESDGAGNLVFSTPSGAGDVSAAANFTTNNRVVLTDTPNGSKNVKESANVVIDGSDNISGVNTLGATTINATTVNAPTLNGNATTATNALNVGGKIAAEVATSVNATQAATNSNIPGTLVLRAPVTGNFSAGMITANLTGNVTGDVSGSAGSATTANSASTFSTSLVGDVTGGQNGSNTVVGSINNGAMSAGTIITGVNLANNSTPNNTLNTIVRRNNTNGGFSSGPITASLLGNANTASLAQRALRSDYAWSFTGLLAGDVTGQQNATVVAFVNGVPANVIAAGSTLASTATWFNTPNTLVLRDGSGNFSAGTITASLNGNATTATTAASATNFTGSLLGDVVGLQSTTTVLTVGGKTRVEIAASVNDTQAATPNNTPADFGKIVRRDASGNFSATTITANITGNVSGSAGTAGFANTAGTATNFSGSLAGDVGGTQSITVVNSVGGQSATAIAFTTTTVSARTDANTPSTLVFRNGSGNFSGGTITAVTGFSGTLTGNVIGSVSGSAGSATTAVTSTTSQWFSQNLAGDVTGPQLATFVNTIQGTSAATVLAGAALANAATDANTAGFIVKRDGSGNFITNMITLNGAVSADTDAATKAYVDSVAGTGLEPKTPVLATSIVNTPTAGLATPIDGVTLSAADRVLLTQQNYQIDNGIWLAQSLDWTRPTDFALGSTAGQAYVLTTSGLTLAGTGWLSSIPLAVVGTDTVTFVQFTSSGQTTGANVGNGVGLFKDKIGLTLNFKSLVEGAGSEFITIAPQGANEVSFGITATSDATPLTLVARDASGAFAGTLVGTATGNLPLTGGTLTGNLIMANESEIRWAQDTGTNYIGFKAPATGTFAYTVNLPGTAPAAGQFLQALDSSSLTWTSGGEAPAATKAFYVSLSGSDSSDGSFGTPFRTIKHAVSQADLVASTINPVTINVGAGIFVEDNSGSPIHIISTADGISIVGSSMSTTIVQPSTLSLPLFSIETPNFELSDFTVDAGAIGTSTNSAINVSTDNPGVGRFNSIVVYRFATGFDLNSAAGVPIILFENIQPRGNTLAMSVNSIRVVIKDSIFLGPISGNTPANTALSIGGSTSLVTLLSTSFRALGTGITTSDAKTRLIGCNFETTENGLICSGASNTSACSCNFTSTSATTINVAASGASAVVNLTGCHFQGSDNPLAPMGTAIKVTNGANLTINSSLIENVDLALVSGAPGEVNSSSLKAGGVYLVATTTDIQQNALAAVRFIGGVFDSDRILINNPTNVQFAAFDRNFITGETTLSIGDTTDTPQDIYEILTGQPSRPTLSYESDYYGFKGTTYINTNTNKTFSGVQSNQNDARYFVVTGDRTKEAGISLISDSGNIGNPDNVRGWTINKLGTSAELAFTFTNNDTASFALRGPYNVMQLNGLDNQVEFPVATGDTLPVNDTAKLVWGGDTNLYRSAANTLKTDDNVVIGTAPGDLKTLTVSSLSTPTGIVHSDATGLLSSSLLVNADIAANAAIADTKLATITTAGKVANSATTATSANTPNTLVLRDGSGNFFANMITASITGTASGNVLKIGDTMTGNLVMAYPSEIRFNDAGSNYVGFKAPATVDTSYSTAWPTTLPTTGQFLQVLNGGIDASLTWTTVGSPALTKTYYVDLSGSNSNDGSLASPFRTIQYAVSVAKVGANPFSNPRIIHVGAGSFTEEKIVIDENGLSIVGSIEHGTIIRPFDPDENLIEITAPYVELSNFTLQVTPGDSSRSAIDMSISEYGRSRFNQLGFAFFNTGISLNNTSTSALPIFMENLQFGHNLTDINAVNSQIIISGSYFNGPTAPSSNPPGYTGISLAGQYCIAHIFSSYFSYLNNAIIAVNGANASISDSSIEKTNNGIICSGASKAQLVGVKFSLNNATSVNVTATGAGTLVYIEECLFDCEDASDNSAGTAIKIVDGASSFINGCIIEKAIIGLECGTSADTATTVMKAGGVSIIDTTTSIRQRGLSTLQFVGGSLDITTLDIANPTNVDFAGFNANGEAHLAIGKIQDISSIMYEVLNGQPALPTLSYEPNYYGYKGTVYANTNDNSLSENKTFNGTQSNYNDAAYYVVTGDNTKEASIKLISDSNNIGGPVNVRGWSISKLGTSGDLAFTYTNNDPGQVDRGPYDVMRLNGFDNQVEFPIATGALPTNLTAKLLWGADTNLYRSAADTLKTDDNFIIGGTLTAGSTFISTLTLSAGTAANPSLQFAGSTNTGLSAQTANRLSFDTNGVERMSIDSTGTVSINQFTVAGVVHNNSSGQLSSSLIVNADIAANANIVDTKLATISTVGKVANSATTAASINTFGAIVARDSIGTFTATGITATNFYGNATTATSAITSTTSTYFIGSLFGDVTGLQSTTSVAAVGGKTATEIAAAVLDVQLSTTINTPNTLVRRNATGDFSAGMITASLTGMVTGTASFNVLKIGDTMTGSLTLPPGTAGAPSLNFSNGTTTGISSPSADYLSFDTLGVERMSILPTGTIVANAGFVFANTMAQGAIQFDASATITVASTISTLILDRTTATTINWPAPTMQGQLFTMVLATSSTFNLTNNVTAPATTIVNEITNFNLTNTYQAPRARCSATYIYYGTTWYLCGRG